MSLDVYLKVGKPVAKRGSGIYIRRNGQTVEVSAEEWNRLHPEQPIAPERMSDYAEQEYQTDRVFEYNITHNLCGMAREAGLYAPCWEAEENGITKAAQLIGPLRGGLAKLEAAPEHYRQFNPPNGWGSYEGLVEFVRAYLAACEEHPDADVSVWR